ncbi:MAG: hypothetical protein C0595_03815 [Marinilabiliales bacterium]|nr:MAG: hypothetical protein C0595_03815 [Marinilabiliales bacterium]
MKRIIKRSLFILLMIITFKTYSNITDSIIIRTYSNSEIVTVDRLRVGTSLKIKDDNGIILHRKEISDSTMYTKSFELSNLPNNTYYLEIENVNEIKIIPLVVNNEYVKYLRSDERTISKPNVQVNGKMVHVNQNSTEEQDFHIIIYYEDQNIAFEEKMRNSKNFSRSYDFTGSLYGDYTIELITEGRTYNNKIHITD